MVHGGPPTCWRSSETSSLRVRTNKPTHGPTRPTARTNTEDTGANTTVPRGVTHRDSALTHVFSVLLTTSAIPMFPHCDLEGLWCVVELPATFFGLWNIAHTTWTATRSCRLTLAVIAHGTDIPLDLVERSFSIAGRRSSLCRHHQKRRRLDVTSV